MSSAVDFLFGGTDKTSLKQQKRENEEIRRYVEQMRTGSRADLLGLWPGAMDSANQGYQSALDMFNQSIPQQASVFQQGNMNAQQTLQGGLDPYMAALMGNPINTGAMQPRGVNADFGWIPDKTPQGPSPADLLGGGQPQAQTPQAMPFGDAAFWGQYYTQRA